MKLAILGGTGRTGREVVRRALDRGYEVCVLVRNPETLGDLPEKVTVIQGDATDAQVVDRLVDGADAVISTLGQSKGSARDLLPTAINHVVVAMRRHGVDRIVVLGNPGIDHHADQRTLKQKMARTLINLTAPGQPKQAKVLEESGLHWTIVRAWSPLKEGPKTGSYRVGLFNGETGGGISTGDVAHFMLDVATSDQYVHEMPVISGDT